MEVGERPVVIGLISVANLASIDWNLFLVLHMVLEEGSATKAAKRLHVTQSAVSNALARLRGVFDDPLVVRIGNQLVPTSKARSLAPHIALVVQQLGHMLDSQRAFDPQSSDRRFTLGVTEEAEAALVPILAERFAQRLPNGTLHCRRAPDAGQGLATGELDAVVGVLASVPTGCLAEELYEDDVVALVRPAHPLVNLADIALYARVHVQSASAEVTLSVPSYATGALVVQRSGYVLYAPSRLAAHLARTYSLRIVLPAEPPVSVSLAWHARTDPDPGARILRALLREVAATAAAATPTARAKRRPARKPR